jgi:hypothetical protein
MKISLDQVFSERYVTDNSYVGWTMQLDCSAALQFLRYFYANWPELVVTIGLERLQGGLRVISYACGVQWRIFNCGNSISLEEKAEILEGACRFFLDHLSQRGDLADLCFMWWDDLGVFLSPPDEEVDDPGRKVLADKLLELLVRAFRQGNEQAQLGAIHGLDCLEHPRTRDELHFMASAVQVTSRVQDALNGLSGD